MSVHQPFCEPALHDPEGICQAPDIDTPDGWTIGLTHAGGDDRAIVHLGHPDVIPLPELGMLTPAEAYDLGWALITQATRGGYSPATAPAGAR